MVEARSFDLSTDYDIISGWWGQHGSFAPKPEHLSPTGIMVSVDEDPVCAGFLYNTDSKICVFEFVVSNPKSPKKDRNAALEHLIDMIKLIAKDRGYSLIYTSINIQAYIKKLTNAGFLEADKNQTHLFCELGGNNG